MKHVRQCLLIASILLACSSPSEKETRELPASNESAGNTANTHSILIKYKLPPLHRMNEKESQQRIDELFMMKRIHTLHVDTADFHDTRRWEKLYEEGKSHLRSLHYDPISFTGSTARELNSFIKSHPNRTIRIQRNIIVDRPVILSDEVMIDGGSHTFRATSKKVFLFDNASKAGIKDLIIEGDFDHGVYIKNGSSLIIQNVTISKCKRRPIVVMGSTEHLFLLDNRISDNAIGGIYLRGKIVNGIIENNTIENNHGTGNFDAGIVMTDLEITDSDDPESGKWKPIDRRLNIPHDLIVRRNHLIGQNSSGIYLDGAMSIYVLENYIAQNDKEGACLDNGTTGVNFIRNTVINNGRRLRQTDDDLKRDFVLELGRDADGGSKAKLPGLSLDNAAYNVIMENTINGNYGSGIKMVRTCVRNIVGTNLIVDNNAGRNDQFHFFGIELGFAPPDTGPLSFCWNQAPDYENIIFSNIIQGPHYVGVFLANDVHLNNIYDNIIMGATHWSIESISAKHNNTLNNLSKIQSKGIALSNSPSIILPKMTR